VKQLHSVSWNYKSTGRKEKDQGDTGKRILRPVQAASCLIRGNNNTIGTFPVVMEPEGSLQSQQNMNLKVVK